jgi:hypothetical protein
MVKMVKLLVGTKGSGKSKKMIEMANGQVGDVKGHIIFIDDDNRNIYELHHNVRFINMEGYPVKNEGEFFGFLCGIVSNDFDIDTIYIDGLKNITQSSDESMIPYFNRLNKFGEKYSVKFVISLSGEPKDVSPELKDMVIEIEKE